MCRQGSHHANYECRILQENNINFGSHQPKFSYLCIQTLRCLLLRENSPKTWNEFLELEPHLVARQSNVEAMQETAQIVNFIRNQCQLTQYEPDLINWTLGVIAINSFQGDSGNE